MWLSGGEPFLREDLADIIKLFHDHNGVRVINLPTNGLLTDRILAQTERILESCPRLTVHLNSSLDGPGGIHDANRGVPGNFEATIRTMRLVKERFGGHPRLLQNVATVITPEAYDSLYDLGAFLVGNELVATHFYEIVRGNPRDPKVKSLTPAEIRRLRLRVMPLIEKQADNLFRNFSGAKKRFAKMFFLGFIRFVNDLQDANAVAPKHWGMSCTAGKTTFVIDANGDFRSCEMRPPVGNLRDYGYNLSAALHSDAMHRVRMESG